MKPRQMPQDEQVVAVGIASMAWFVVGAVCAFIGLVAAVSQRSFGDFVGGLVVGFFVGGFAAWLAWFSRMYLTSAGRAHQAWERGRRAQEAAAYAASQPPQQVVYTNNGGYNNNDLAVATGLIVGGLYGVQSEIAYMNHYDPAQHNSVASQAYVDEMARREYRETINHLNHW